MARTGAIVFTWGETVRGRERKALEVFGEALGYYEELAKEGRIISHREYLSGGGAGGMMIIEGLLPELHELAQDDDFVRLFTRATMIVEDMKMQIYAGGSDQTVAEMTTTFAEVLDELDL